MWFPDIDGEWHAELESNWELIAQRAGLDTPRPTEEPTRARITIISRLFLIKINLTTEYSCSSTSSVSVTRNEEDGSFQLAYLYRNRTLKPLETDSSTHNGAGWLQVIQEPNGEVWMQGSYWTDRNWHKAMNTAGRITLRRQQVEHECTLARAEAPVE
jgi:SMODS-associating 2TM, beta-strand rich effector domain